MAFTGLTGQGIRLFTLLRFTTSAVNRSKVNNLIPSPVGLARAIWLGHLLVIFIVVGERSRVQVNAVQEMQPVVAKVIAHLQV